MRLLKITIHFDKVLSNDESAIFFRSDFRNADYCRKYTNKKNDVLRP